MLTYKYKAIDKSGKELKGEIEASGIDDAINVIKKLGHFPTYIVRKSKKIGVSRVVTARQPRRQRGRMPHISIPGLSDVNPKELTLFTRQLSTLIAAGLPLVRSLNILQNQLKGGTVKWVVRNLSEEVEAGGSFSESLGKYPRIFPKLYVNSIRAGELGGVLEMVLARLADFSEKDQRLKAKIKSALLYPIVVVMLALTILVFLLLFVIPKFVDLFKEIGVDLPLPTRILIGASSFVREQWYIALGAVILSVIAFNLLKQIAAFRFYVDYVKLRLPVFGMLMNKMMIADFAHTLGTLLPSGVPILQALDVTRETCGNEVVSRAILRVHSSVREGESIAGPLGKSKIFPLMVTNMIDVGEETGTLDDMLNKIAEIYEAEVDTTVAGLTSLLEPILIIGMAVIVGFIVISMFLPLVKLLTALSA